MTLRPWHLALLATLLALPARAAEPPPSFITHVTRLAFFVEAAPLCGLRSLNWSHDLLDALVAVVELTRDGSAAHNPTPSDIEGAMRHVKYVHDLAAPTVTLNPHACQNARQSAGLRDADGMVRRLREGRL